MKVNLINETYENTLVIIALALKFIAIIAILSHYPGKIDLKLGLDGGHLKIDGRGWEKISTSDKSSLLDGFLEQNFCINTLQNVSNNSSEVSIQPGKFDKDGSHLNLDMLNEILSAKTVKYFI
jgi:hypothetical protein